MIHSFLVETVSGIDCCDNRRSVRAKRAAKADRENTAVGITHHRNHFSCWASLCCPWNCSFPCSRSCCHFRGREDDNRPLNPHWSALAVDYASGTVGLGAGRRSHSCSESLSKPPTPPKILCSARNTSSPSVTTATALESTIYIRRSSHLSIKACLNCQSIILHRKLPTHLLLGTFLCSATELGPADTHPSHTFTPNDTQTI